jgi:hypothetical protein
MAASCVHAELHAPQLTAISWGVNFILAQLYIGVYTCKNGLIHEANMVPENTELKGQIA